MIAMCVGDVNCGEVLTARDDPAQQSLRLLNCEKSVHEDSVSLAVARAVAIEMSIAHAPSGDLTCDNSPRESKSTTYFLL
jgi:hypothetical protein